MRALDLESFAERCKQQQQQQQQKEEEEETEADAAGAKRHASMAAIATVTEEEKAENVSPTTEYRAAHIRHESRREKNRDSSPSSLPHLPRDYHRHDYHLHPHHDQQQQVFNGSSKSLTLSSTTMESVTAPCRLMLREVYEAPCEAFLQPTRLFDHLRQSRGSVQDQAYEKGDAGVVGKARQRGAHLRLPVPRMAVLVTGFIRSWSQVHDAFVENILDANPPGSVDVFFYVPFDGEVDNGAATESEKDRLAGGTGESGGEKEAAEAERIQCEHAALEKMRSMPGAVVETYRLHDPVTGDPAVERNHPQYGRCVALFDSAGQYIAIRRAFELMERTLSRHRSSRNFSSSSSSIGSKDNEKGEDGSSVAALTAASAGGGAGGGGDDTAADYDLIVRTRTDLLLKVPINATALLLGMRRRSTGSADIAGAEGERAELSFSDLAATRRARGNFLALPCRGVGWDTFAIGTPDVMRVYANNGRCDGMADEMPWRVAEGHRFHLVTNAKAASAVSNPNVAPRATTTTTATTTATAADRRRWRPRRRLSSSDVEEEEEEEESWALSHLPRAYNLDKAFPKGALPKACTPPSPLARGFWKILSTDSGTGGGSSSPSSSSSVAKSRRKPRCAPLYIIPPVGGLVRNGVAGPSVCRDPPRPHDGSAEGNRRARICA